MAGDYTRTNIDIVDRIEYTHDELLRQLQEGEPLSIRLKRRRSTGESSLGTRPDTETRGVVTITFPGRTEDEAWRFAVIMRILGIIHQALKSGVVVSKRDIYYQDPALFSSQRIIDAYIEDIALTLDVPRFRLNVSAAAKGLIRGPVLFQLHDGTVQDASFGQGVLIPDMLTIRAFRVDELDWILIIEKEASYRSLLGSVPSHILSNGLVITAKGYPDVATRQLLRTLREHFMTQDKMPKFSCLVDFDPDGYSIYSNYKHGSQRPTVAMATLCLPELELLPLEDTSQPTEASPLTQRDRKRATNMLRKDPAAHEPTFRKGLQDMLMLNTKLEIQQMGTIDSSAFLPTTLSSH